MTAAERMRKWRRLNPERSRERDRQRDRKGRYKTPEDLLKRHARNVLNAAVRKGKIQRLPCEVCGATETIHAHHENYREPLRVRWLCRLHHEEHHAAQA